MGCGDSPAAGPSPAYIMRRARTLAVQERNAVAVLDYLDVALGGRLIERIEIGGAVHEADRGQSRGEVE